jgi:hypothetical protein
VVEPYPRDRGDRRRLPEVRHGRTSAAQEKTFLNAIIEGKRVLAFAFAEPQGRYNLADLPTTAKKRRRRLHAERPQGRRHRRALGDPR